MRARRAPEHAGSAIPIGLLVVVVDGLAACGLHRSVLDRAVDIATRLGCRSTRELNVLPGIYQGAELKRVRRDLAEITAFADAAHHTGWRLDTLSVSPGELPVPVLQTAHGQIWVDAVRGISRCDPDGPPEPFPDAAAHRVPLRTLLAPLTSAAARATTLEIHSPSD